MMHIKKLVPFGISTALAILVAVVLLLFINASLLKIPLRARGPDLQAARPQSAAAEEQSRPEAAEYGAIGARNLFRAKLDAELPKQKTEKEIEEEALSNVMRTMALKGIMTGQKKSDYYAVIDRGGQKGVWTYEIGEVVERGLTITDIRKDSVSLQKADFKGILKLFSHSYERVPGMQAAVATKETLKKSPGQPAPAQKARPSAIDFNKEIRKEGNTTVISRSLATQIKADNNLLMSSLAIKMETDARGEPAGYRIVSVDKGSLAQKIGILDGDKLVEINGFKLTTTEDLKKAYDILQVSSRFDIKVLRGGRTETLQYAIR